MNLDVWVNTAPRLPGIIMEAGVGAKVLVCTHEALALVYTLSST